MHVRLRWRLNIRGKECNWDGEDEHDTIKNDTGVTVRDPVDAVRRALANVATEMAAYRYELDLISRYCRLAPGESN